jgi:hypothetical protein
MMAPRRAYVGDVDVNDGDTASSITNVLVMRASDAVIVWIVVAVASIFAAAMLVDYAGNPAQLWHGLSDDRNTHFGAGLNIVFALRSFDVPRVVQLLAQARIWPPVADILLALILIFGGIDVRLAILPSLIGWICTIIITFLIARRLFTDRLSGNIAGSIAIVFALASPAFRLISADVMLEGPGAGLTAFCLYAYVLAHDKTGRDNWWGVLAIGLTVLFFEKYNYWLMTAVSLAIAYFSEDFWARWIRVCTHLAHVSRERVRAIVGDPFIIVAGSLILLDIAIYNGHLTDINSLGFHVNVRDTWKDVETLIWAILFVRATLLWREYRKPFDTALGLAGRRLFYWHLCPIAISFLIPKRLSDFIWYVAFNSHGEPYDPLAAVSSQWRAFSQGFHVAPWAAILALALAFVAAIRLGRLAPSARAVLILAGLSALAVIVYPQQQWRFQASWLFSVWILAGAGGAIALSSLTARLGTFAQGAVAAAAIATLAVAESRYGWSDVAYAAAARPHPGEPSDLDLARAYLPYIHGAEKVGFLTTLPVSNFYGWTIQENCQCAGRTYTPELEPLRSREQYRADTAEWLLHTPVERVVVIDTASYQPQDFGKTYDTLSGQIDAIKHDPKFERIATVPVPTWDATITIWRRRS